MVRESTKSNFRPNWEELSPALREAVVRVCSDPLPEAVARRGAQAAARQIARFPNRAEPRFAMWIGPIVAAPVLLLGMMAGFWTVRTAGIRLMNLPTVPAPLVSVAPPPDANLHIAGAYAHAARQSPEALLTLMDQQSQWSNSGKSLPTIKSGMF